MKTPAYLPSRDPRPRDPEADALPLSAHLHVLWRNRLLLLGCAVLGGAVAYTAGRMSPRLFVAEAALSISRPKFGDGASDPVSTANFRPLIESRTVAAQAIKDTGLDKPPYSLSPTAFFGSVVDVEEVRGSSVILLTGRLTDPELVARVVNRVAELGVETGRRVSQQEALQARNDIKLQLDEAKARLDTAINNLERTRVSSQLELVKRDVESALGQRAGLLGLLISIESERTKLAKAEDELKKRSRVETVTRSIDADPALMEAARSGETRSRDLLGLQIKNQELNNVYSELDREVALSRMKLASMEKQKAQMDARRLSNASLKELNDLYAKEALLGRLEVEQTLANDVYKRLATSYENARLLVSGRTSALQIISPAIAPDRPDSRKLTRSMLIGSTSAVLLASLILLVVHAFGSEKRLAQGSRA